MDSVLRRAGKLHCSLRPLPHRQSRKEGCPARVNTSGPTLYSISGLPRQRNMAHTKEQSKTSELSKEDIASLSDGEFKALVIKMLTELIEPGQNMKQQMKDTQNEVKQNIQGTNSDKKETRFRAMIWNKRKK